MRAGVGGWGQRVGRFLSLRFKKKKSEVFPMFANFCAFQISFSVAFHLEVQCDVVAFEVVRFLVESVASNDVHSISFRGKV